MTDMIGIIELIKNTTPVMSNAIEFRVFSIQKLTLSVLKNLNPREKIIAKTLLLINLISHPIYFLRLLFSLKFNGLGLINE
jgi:hypothetical protein